MHSRFHPPSDLESALLDALMHQPRMGVAVCDNDGVLLIMNAAMQDALSVGYSPTSAPSWAGHYHLHDEQGRPLPSGADPLARALRGEHLTDHIVSVRRLDGPVRWLSCSAFPLQDPSAKELGAAVFVLDVTTRVAEQHRLNHLRDRLVGMVNHEVRTPLAVIAGHVELLEPAAAALPEPAQWSLGAIARGVHRLREVVATISDLADESQSPPSDPPTGPTPS